MLIFLNCLKCARVKNIVLVTKIAVNIEQIIPTLKVVAKPLIGPDPIKDRTNAVNNVVMFASKIVSKALLYPLLIALDGIFPKSISSLILSKIITLASTVIPTVKSNPAIPGNVKTAFIDTKTPNTMRRFKRRAKLAITPEPL